MKPTVVDKPVVGLIARLDQPDEVIDQLLPLLDDEELDRAASFRRPILRTRFIAGRAFLRMALGHQLGKNPRSLRFAYGRHGKPSLHEPLLRLLASDTCVSGRVSNPLAGASGLHTGRGLDV